LLSGNKWQLEYSMRFPKAGNGNGNEVMGMGGNGYTKVTVIPAHTLYDKGRTSYV